MDDCGGFGIEVTCGLEAGMSRDEQVIGAEADQRDKGERSGAEGGTRSPAAPETRKGTPRDEEAKQGLNPSAPGQTGTTPGSNAT